MWHYVTCLCCCNKVAPDNIIDYLLDWLVNVFVHGMDSNYNCLPKSSSLNTKLITSCWHTNSAKVINDIIHINYHREWVNGWGCYGWLYNMQNVVCRSPPIFRKSDENNVCTKICMFLTFLSLFFPITHLLTLIS